MLNSRLYNKVIIARILVVIIIVVSALYGVG
jgi:hypothetical protein